MPAVELAGIETDDATIDGARGGEIGLRGQHLRLPGRDARFGLGDVGAGDFADIEAIAGLPKLLLRAPRRCAFADRRSRRRAARSCRRLRASSSTACSITRKVSRAENTCASAWRVRLPVWKPLNNVCVIGRAVTGRVKARHLAVARTDGTDTRASSTEHRYLHLGRGLGPGDAAIVGAADSSDDSRPAPVARFRRWRAPERAEH